MAFSSGETLVAGLGIVLWLIIIFGIVLGTVFWIWMLVDCATKDKDPDRLVWVIIIIFTHILGAALYYFIRRPVR